MLRSVDISTSTIVKLHLRSSEIINETDTPTELTVEKQGKELIAQTNLSSSNLIKEFEREQLKKQLPEIYVGDTVKVGVKITEGNKERVQPYEGVVIAKRHGGLHQTITVRRIFQGIGVERVFMLHSPQVASLKVERRGKVRRAKLFYLRDRVGKATRVKQRFDR
jgi:large subunit ribosomal protein L19